MEKLKCRYCDITIDGTVKVDEELASIGSFQGLFQVHCYMCGAKGPVKETPEAAIEAWNKR